MCICGNEPSGFVKEEKSPYHTELLQLSRGNLLNGIVWSAGQSVKLVVSWNATEKGVAW